VEKNPKKLAQIATIVGASPTIIPAKWKTDTRKVMVVLPGGVSGMN
jgi:hypothetical protein